MTLHSVEDLRVAAGLGMGSTNLDNELIMEAFIMGAGMGCGVTGAYLDLDESRMNEVAAFCLMRVSEVTGMELEE